MCKSTTSITWKFLNQTFRFFLLPSFHYLFRIIIWKLIETDFGWHVHFLRIWSEQKKNFKNCFSSCQKYFCCGCELWIQDSFNCIHHHVVGVIIVREKIWIFSDFFNISLLICLTRKFLSKMSVGEFHFSFFFSL